MDVVTGIGTFRMGLEFVVLVCGVLRATQIDEVENNECEQ
jgi:hypothetical protein